MKDRYDDVAFQMGCFKDECLEDLQTSPLEQIWRDHLLAGSLLYSPKPKDDFKDGFFVFLSPQENIHCQEAVEQYKQYLTIDRTFQSWTLENVTKVIKQNTKKKWIDDVIERYLNFWKVGL